MSKTGLSSLTENKTDAVPYWQQPVEGLFSTLDSRPEGLTEEEAERRLDEVGVNSLETRKSFTTLGLFLNQFKSPIVLILLAATIVSVFVHDWTDALIILIIVLGSAVLSFSQEYSASHAAEELRLQISIKARVLRSGNEQAVPAECIVPGDVVLLSAGSLIPADGVLLEAKDFFVNQAVLTGETFPVEKRPCSVSASAGLPERTNCVFMGTNVRSGSGKALIVQTGSHTCYGQIAKRLSLRPPENEFERGVRHLGYLLTEVMFVLVVIIFAVNVFFHKPILEALLFSIALAVGLTPQLLPAIININLSKGSQVMAAKGVIVRRLVSIENFGSMDILCTDKTGTLTLGVVRLDSALDAEGNASPDVLQLAWLNARYQSGMANPLDDAILQAGSFETPPEAKVDEIPYDFIRKRLSVVVVGTRTPLADLQSGRLLITKGAFENVLEVCTSLRVTGAIQALDNAKREALHRRYADWSVQGYRVLGVAMRAVEVKDRYERDDETGLTFFGF